MTYNERANLIKEIEKLDLESTAEVLALVKRCLALQEYDKANEAAKDRSRHYS